MPILYTLTDNENKVLEVTTDREVFLEAVRRAKEAQVYFRANVNTVY